jgi:hypothetical protein
MNFKNLTGLATMAFVLPLFANGCNQLTSVADAACCKEYIPGTDMSKAQFGISDLKVRGQFQATAQGAGDLVSLADTLLVDVTNACRNIAIDLGTSNADIETNDKKPAPEKVEAWCTAAAGLLNKALAGAQLNAKFDAEVKCEASISANVDCKARCDVNAKCDVKLNPPVCKGGELTVDCKGTCAATVDLPKISCEGSCSATCEGSCTATATAPTVVCNGTCSGACEVNGQAGTNGTKSDGTCGGTCRGTCTSTPGSAAVTCAGKCEGKCAGSCTAAPGSASVKCSGKCDADFTPIECKGGTLEGGCQVDAKCEGSCNASAQAKASCSPPVVRFEASASPQVQAAIDTLVKNLPDLLVAVKARGEAFAKLVETFGTNISVSGDIGVSGGVCLTRMAATLGEAVPNVQKSLAGAVKVTGAAQIK